MATQETTPADGDPANAETGLVALNMASLEMCTHEYTLPLPPPFHQMSFTVQCGQPLVPGTPCLHQPTNAARIVLTVAGAYDQRVDKFVFAAHFGTGQRLQSLQLWTPLVDDDVPSQRRTLFDLDCAAAWKGLVMLRRRLWQYTTTPVSTVIVKSTSLRVKEAAKFAFGKTGWVSTSSRLLEGPHMFIGNNGLVTRGNFIHLLFAELRLYAFDGIEVQVVVVDDDGVAPARDIAHAALTLDSDSAEDRNDNSD